MRRGWWLWPLVVLMLLSMAAGGYVWIEHSRTVELGSARPADGSVLGTGSVTLSFELNGYRPGRGTPSLFVDRIRIDAGDLGLLPGLVESTQHLADGEHTAVLEYTSANPFCRHLRKAITFIVDTVPPGVTISAPQQPDRLSEAEVTFEAALSEPAEVELTLDGTPLVAEPVTAQMASAGGAAAPISVAANTTLTDGPHEFVLTATDSAGNVSTVRLAVRVDLQPPVIEAAGWPEGDWKEPSGSLSFKVRDNSPGLVRVTAALDGQAVVPRPRESEPGTSAGPASGVAAAELAAAEFTVQAEELIEGLHELSFSAVDEVGHSTTWTRTFRVDSSDVFGERPMGPGAIGEDVSRLQGMLAGRGYYSGSATGTYDEPTGAAVAAYKAACGIEDEGRHVQIADLATLELLLGSITIDLSARKLSLYRDGRLEKTYSVAVGMPAYPTPVGSFRIISKIPHPTWTPPNSPWAAGLSPVPPGPGNPLGTRWMGISSPSVGIHGTYASGSIGTAASHGCIRMRIHEAEELFELVYVGTPVTIVE